MSKKKAPPEQHHDFEARLTLRPGVLPKKLGWRPDFAYNLDELTYYMIHPVAFMDENGVPYPPDAQVSGTFYAKMAIVSEPLRRTVHRQRIKEGLPFLVMNGNEVKADGVVTKITGLFDEVAG